jgi:hypothetical protein
LIVEAFSTRRPTPGNINISFQQFFHNQPSTNGEFPMRIRSISTTCFLALAAAALLAAGCSKPAGNGSGSVAQAPADDRTDDAHEEEGHDHEGEGEEDSGHNFKGRDWCAEHGVPESDCSMCNSKVAAKFKEKGDWCEEHDRADSQCFICHPEHQEKFAKLYRTKYGEDPPPVEVE